MFRMTVIFRDRSEAGFWKAVFPAGYARWLARTFGMYLGAAAVGVGLFTVLLVTVGALDGLLWLFRASSRLTSQGIDFLDELTRIEAVTLVYSCVSLALILSDFLSMSMGTEFRNMLSRISLKPRQLLSLERPVIELLMLLAAFHLLVSSMFAASLFFGLTDSFDEIFRPFGYMLGLSSNMLATSYVLVMLIVSSMAYLFLSVRRHHQDRQKQR
jgi:hypothetical protein